jgi:ribose 5-phosphate isomerase B
MRIAFGTDERTAVTDELEAHLARCGHELVGPVRDVPWPTVGRAVGESVAQGRAKVGIVMCWTGTGVSIAANKVPGVRAALCTDRVTAEGSRRWNDANVLAMGSRLTTVTTAVEMIDGFLATEVDADERANIDRLEAD